MTDQPQSVSFAAGEALLRGGLLPAARCGPLVLEAEAKAMTEAQVRATLIVAIAALHKQQAPARIEIVDAPEAFDALWAAVSDSGVPGLAPAVLCLPEVEARAVLLEAVWALHRLTKTKMTAGISARDN